MSWAFCRDIRGGIFENTELPEPVNPSHPEIALLCAFTERAWNDMTGTTASREERRTAREWFLSLDTHQYSFLGIMEYLGWSEDRVRHIQRAAFASFTREDATLELDACPPSPALEPASPSLLPGAVRFVER